MFALVQDLDRIVPLLLQKTGDTNRFIRDDARAALINVTRFVTAPKAIVAIVNDGVRYCLISPSFFASFRHQSNVSLRRGPAVRSKVKTLTQSTISNSISYSSKINRYIMKIYQMIKN